MILSTLDINIIPLIAGAGIAGLAFALAAKDILSNFFDGAMIMVDKHLKLIDRIQVDEFIGDVMSIGPISTRLMTVDYQMVTIPNSKIATSVIINYAQPEARIKIRIPVSLAYGSNVPLGTNIDGYRKISSRRIRLYFKRSTSTSFFP